MGRILKLSEVPNRGCQWPQKMDLGPTKTFKKIHIKEGNSYYNRTVVCDTSNGSCIIKTIQNPWDCKIYYLSLCNQQIVLIHYFPKSKISHFNIE